MLSMSSDARPLSAHYRHTLDWRCSYSCALRKLPRLNIFAAMKRIQSNFVAGKGLLIGNISKLRQIISHTGITSPWLLLRPQQCPDAVKIKLLYYPSLSSSLLIWHRLMELSVSQKQTYDGVSEVYMTALAAEEVEVCGRRLGCNGTSQRKWHEGGVRSVSPSSVCPHSAGRCSEWGTRRQHLQTVKANEKKAAETRPRVVLAAPTWRLLCQEWAVV